MRLLTLFTLALLALPAAPTSAQTYPSRTVTVVVPIAAGGAVDTTGRIFAEQFIRSSVPQQHAAGAVISRRDRPFKIAVGDGVIFYMDCKSFLLRIKRGPFWDGPREQHAVQLQAQVVMQSARAMSLNTKAIT